MFSFIGICVLLSSSQSFANGMNYCNAWPKSISGESQCIRLKSRYKSMMLSKDICCEHGFRKSADFKEPISTEPQPDHRFDKIGFQFNKPSPQIDKPGPQVDKPGSQLHKAGSQLPKAGSQLHKPGSQFETVNLSDHQGLRGFANFGGTTTAVFLGIPFALPPLGERRYRKPEAIPAWTGIRNALDLSPTCLQIPYGQSTVQGAEDCLYLNVFTPSTTNGSLSVMVWIHGGGFAFGSGIYWDGTRLAGEGGVVVVTFNYRLEALGFASTGEDVMPGNYGMLDQLLALKWVQSHIHAFGGDPRRVTVFGNSAGSTSISLHLLSPLSVRLFHRAIMESGSSFSLWGVERKKESLDVSERSHDDDCQKCRMSNGG